MDSKIAVTSLSPGPSNLVNENTLLTIDNIPPVFFVFGQKISIKKQNNRESDWNQKRDKTVVDLGC